MFTVIDILALMAAWNIQLNAVSVANRKSHNSSSQTNQFSLVVVTVGFVVETMAFIARGYVEVNKKRLTF